MVAETMTARVARCTYCRTTAPSSPHLAFFQYRGEGSRAALESCKGCGYGWSAHDPVSMSQNVPSNRRTVIDKGMCKGFVAHGAFEFDEYYCGCRGWD